MNSDYLDYGVKIPGAKKFFYIHDYSDIQDKNLKEQYIKATKYNIWQSPQPTNDPLRDFIIKAIRNALICRPLGKDQESIRQYVKVISSVRDIVENTHSHKELTQVLTLLYNYLDGSNYLRRSLEPVKILNNYKENLNKEPVKRKKKFKVSPILKEHLIHSGSDYRHGRYIKTKELAETFHLKGIQYGNYVSEKERMLLVDYCYDALADLASYLQIPRELIGFDNLLSISFGARGSGHANAHYEPQYQVINLTRLKGQGTLAHEWMHALDHYLGIIYGFDSLMSDNYNECPNKEFKKLIQYLADPRTEYYLNSTDLDILENRRKYYWSTKREMLARAFESFIINELEKNGIRNDYLSTIEGFKDKENNTYFPYPRGKDKEIISNLFIKLFESLKNDGILNLIKIEKVASL